MSAWCEWHQFQGLNVVIHSQYRQKFRACGGLRGNLITPTSGINIIIFGCLCKSNCGPFRGLEWFSPVPGALPDVTEAVPSQGVVNTKSSTGFLERARRTVFGLQVRARMRSAPCRSPVVIHAPTFCVCASRPVAATGRDGGVVGRPRPCHSLARSHVCS